MARPSNEVRCTVIQERGDATSIAFRLGEDLSWSAHGPLGPEGISAQAADLVDLALSAFVVEKQIASRAVTNPVMRVVLEMPVRDPRPWEEGGGAAAAEELLSGMALASWSVVTRNGRKRPIPESGAGAPREVQQVALFSGGLDSTSGTASIHKHHATTALVSFYTRQRTLQRELAGALGFDAPVQFSMKWTGIAGRGHSFRYRSFLFLSLAAAVASSWKAGRILQFENGILASSVAPAPSFNMTRHAHPALHRSAEAVFKSVLGTAIAVENPFFYKTKRQGVAATPRRFRNLLERTETCWYLYANHISGTKKPLRVACGVCIPCLVRRTALENEERAIDLNQDTYRNDEKLGRAFRSYYAFLQDVRDCGNASPRFYQLLSADGRDLVMRDGIPLDELHHLFRTFAKEFFATFP
jgi:7-cyano-7-deazaguanine synthase in queuosine biosynthesis